MEPDLFKAAMAQFASGVTIVTTTDEEGRDWGFTASAFCSLSVDPPLVLVCLATNADSHPAFAASSGFIVNVLRREHADLALRFASKGVNKFDGQNFRAGHSDGLPVLDDALVNLKCATHALCEGGDHSILIGRVEYAHVQEGGEPALMYSRRFWDLAAASDL
jgi:flavin reductase ActVB